MTYQPKVYRDTGGNRQVTASGGEQKVESGGIVTHDAGSLVYERGTLLKIQAAPPPRPSPQPSPPPN